MIYPYSNSKYRNISNFNSIANKILPSPHFSFHRSFVRSFNEEENEEVDVLGSGSEREAASPQPSTPIRPSAPQPPSGEQEEDDGWVTKVKRRRRSPAIQLVLPKDEQTTTPSVALRESPNVTRLRKERRTGMILDAVTIIWIISSKNKSLKVSSGSITSFASRPVHNVYQFINTDLLAGKFQGVSTTVHQPIKKSEKALQLLKRGGRARVRLGRNHMTTPRDREIISRRCGSRVKKKKK
ncbi:hypothetical protein E2C01_039135 [Portunus trituberculatus]|uniref:Uncharacterized protein n=1 Tax=Portunus trituberculatus TaxID=210409 RepID=A0A5B7FJ18_PORTR|nr:hypothetical protein [Portunus trituberculatus]